ncbi:hypothetical protein ACH4VR_36465 [Streptomyces sp. NPDC020883]|uniref:hypothetical protein n=1 Tax=Streptomyces sp. NPDC020883 TaxID=3365099 RepID=UPI0037BD03BF
MNMFERDWVPSTTISIPCGVYFDVVRVSADLGAGALRLLGEDVGPVLANPLARVVYFIFDLGIIPPGSWAVQGTCLMRPNARISIPPAGVMAGKDVHWVVPPSGETWALDPDDLKEALAGRQPSQRERRSRAARTRTRQAIPRPLVPSPGKSWTKRS